MLRREEERGIAQQAKWSRSLPYRTDVRQRGDCTRLQTRRSSSGTAKHSRDNNHPPSTEPPTRAMTRLPDTPSTPLHRIPRRHEPAISNSDPSSVRTAMPSRNHTQLITSSTRRLPQCVLLISGRWRRSPLPDPIEAPSTKGAFGYEYRTHRTRPMCLACQAS